MASLMVRKVTVLLEAFTTLAGVSPERGLSDVSELCTPRALSSGVNSLGGRGVSVARRLSPSRHLQGFPLVRVLL